MGRSARSMDNVLELEGSETSKRRLQAFIKSLSPGADMNKLAEEAGLNRSRFFQLRKQFLQDALSGLEPKKCGRKSKAPTPEQQRILELEADVKEREVALERYKVQVELATALPGLLGRPRAKKKRRKTVDP